ncbi:MAG: hypothetical protein ABUL67_03345 [Haliangium ochraceum]
MLEPWIIEQIRRREEEERRRNERPQLEIPAGDERGDRWRNHHEDPDRRDKDRGDSGDEDRDRKKDDQPERGVMIIDFGVG